MSTSEILARFDELNIWRQGDQRAPHKPLLVLYALGRWQQGTSVVAYADVERDFTMLLREFGPPRKSDHPEQPFWRLQNDGLWTVNAPSNLQMNVRGDMPTATALRSNVRAGFSADVQAALTADPTLVAPRHSQRRRADA